MSSVRMVEGGREGGREERGCESGLTPGASERVQSVLCFAHVS